MRTRALVVITMLTLPSLVSGQGARLPRVGPRSVPQAQPLPPEAPPVARALAYKRSRWSGEAYSLVSSHQVPVTGGGTSSYTTFGAGTRADYRYTDHVSATLDMTASMFGSPTITATAEAGARFHLLPWGQALRPFVDIRAAYAYMYDTFVMPIGSSIAPGGSSQQYSETGRYSRGFGSVMGTGIEYSLTSSLAVTTGLSAMRSRMTMYRQTGPATVPTGSGYWMTSFRYVLGLRYNPVSALHLAQNPTK